MPARHAHQMAIHAGRYAAHLQDTQQPTRPPVATPFDVAVARASALTDEERNANTSGARYAFQEFRAGRGCMELWCVLVDALNVSETLAVLHSIAPDHLHSIQAGLNALAAVYARQLTSWTLRGTEIHALSEALFIWRVQCDYCCLGDMAQARAYVIRRSQQVQRNHTLAAARVVGNQPPTGATE